MGKPNKEKKEARKERQAQLKEASQRIYERLLQESLEPKEEVAYVLPGSGDGKEEEHASTSGGGSSSNSNASATVSGQCEGSSAAAVPSSEGEDGEERVVLPAMPGAAAATAKKAARTTGRKHTKMPWQALKLEVAARYGPEAAGYVGEHDGNAEDPFFTVLLKMQPRTVPVPRHWALLRSFLAHQADREEAVGIVPAEIAALGVDKIRASKGKKVAPDQKAFLTCFLTGTPLQRKTFEIPLSRFGDTFYEGKWLPKASFTPGQLSQRLRQALGMGPSSPPPWLYAFQAMRRLPPAYPSLRIPGLNAPIPPGAQWGMGQGQWGDPPRSEGNAFLFPGVMDEAAGEVSERVLWGTVPPLASSDAPAAAPAKTGTASPPPMPAQKSAPAAGNKPGPTINPVPFQPMSYAQQQQQQFQAGGRPVSTVPQEYVRVQNSNVGSTAAVGHVMMPKGSVAAQQQPQHQPPRAPAQPSSKTDNRGNKF